MKTSLIYILTGLLFLTASCAFAAPGEYSVSNGDTLWGLAGKYYNDPWKWTAIFEANKGTIQDPHWIYLEQKIEIPGVMVASASLSQAPGGAQPAAEPAVAPEAAEPQKTVEVVEPAAPPEKNVEVVSTKYEPTRRDESLTGDAFVVEGPFKYDGRIIGIKEKKTMIAQGDIAYTDIGSEKGLSRGSKCYIFRKKGNIKKPGTNIIVGTQVIRVGILELTSEVNKHSSTAVIIRSYEPIVMGDYIKIIK
jgi:nucleoid-associated protein YgaU